MNKAAENSRASLHVPCINGTEREVVFRFNPPGEEQEIMALQKNFGYWLPADYIDFLKTCNGCRLFEHPQYGSENLLYSVEEVLESKAVMDAHYEFPEEYMNVAYILGDYIKLNLKDVAAGKEHYMYVVGASSSIDCMKSLHCNFETWLNRFIICQGEKYWDWWVGGQN